MKNIPAHFILFSLVILFAAGCASKVDIVDKSDIVGEWTYIAISHLNMKTAISFNKEGAVYTGMMLSTSNEKGLYTIQNGVVTFAMTEKTQYSTRTRKGTITKYSNGKYYIHFDGAKKTKELTKSRDFK